MPDSFGNAIILHETSIRLAGFFLLFGLVATLEAIVPRRSPSLGRRSRWPSNLAIVALNTLAIRLLFPIAAVGVAIIAAERGFGLFHWVAAPPWIAFIGTLVLLDLTVYLQHRLVHRVPMLWRLHRVHHADLDVDVTSGARFHPLEIVFSMVIKVAVGAALGAPPSAIITFEVLLNATAMFNHGNFRIPDKIDSIARTLIVTPDMHRVHHSVELGEQNHNFGFNLPWWDYLFGTYRSQPRSGHTGMTIGVADERSPSRCNGLVGMLAMPFTHLGLRQKPRFDRV